MIKFYSYKKEVIGEFEMLLSNLAQYHLWAGDQAREILSTLTEEEFSKNLGEVIGSVREKVEHIVLSIETGFAFLRNDWKGYQKKTEHVESLSTKRLLEYWAEKDKVLSKELEKENFNPVIIQRTGPSDYFKMQGEDLLIQYILHTVYHRGQLNYCLRALGKNRIEADYLYYFDELNIH